MANVLPLISQSVAQRMQAGASMGSHSFDIFELINAMQADLVNIVTYLATHQHSALNAAPATGTPAVTGAALLASAPFAPTGAAPVLFTQP